MSVDPVAAWARLADAAGLPARSEDTVDGFRQSLGAFARHLVGAGRLRDAVASRERAGVRLSAGLADRWGLRETLGVDAGGLADPVFAWDASDPDVEPGARDLAIRGWHEAATSPLRPLLDAAMEATAATLGAVPHPLRMGRGPEGHSCRDCAWNRKGRCLQVGPPWDGSCRIPARAPSCARWEPALNDDSCASCGACCREGYSMAPVRRGEAMLAAHPEWIVGKGRDAHLPRPGGPCIALAGNGSPEAPWRCRDYAVRPRACSGLDVGGRGCLEARRRTGLSAG